MSDKIGLGSIHQQGFKPKKPDMSKPELVKPKEYVQSHRTMPNDDVLIHYKGGISRDWTPKTVRMQTDAHTALKQISFVENKPMREVINDVIESYIKKMPESEKKLVMPSVRAAQFNMPEDKDD